VVYPSSLRNLQQPIVRAATSLDQRARDGDSSPVRRGVAACRAVIPEDAIVADALSLSIHVWWQLVGEMELAVDDFYARTERCATRRAADREE
jgi:hypothetical protein